MKVGYNMNDNNDNKIPRLQWKVVIIIVLTLVILLVGTAAAGVFDHVFTIRLFNDEPVDDIPRATPTAIPGGMYYSASEFYVGVE